MKTLLRTIVLGCLPFIFACTDQSFHPAMLQLDEEQLNQLESFDSDRDPANYVHIAQRLFQVANFNQLGSMQGWQFSNGPEYPGATGYFRRVAGGKFKAGAELKFTRTCNVQGPTCNPRYVKALKRINSRGRVFWLWTKSNELEPQLTVIDSQGVRHRLYMGSIPMSVKPGQWFRRSAAIQNPARVKYPLRHIEILTLKPEYSMGSSLFVDEVTAGTNAQQFRRIKLNPISNQGFKRPERKPASWKSHFGFGMGNETEARMWDRAKEIGASFIRTPIRWGVIEKRKGVYDWSSFDLQLAMAKTRQLKVLAILAGGNPLYTGSNNNRPQTDMQIAKFAAFAKAAARRYRNEPSVMFEVFNEPNLGGWPRRPAGYVKAMKATIAAIRSVHPRAEIISAGVAAALRPGQQSYLRTILQTPVTKSLSAIGVHTYTYNHADPPEYQRSRWTRTSMMIRRNVGNLPIFETEWGISAKKLAKGGNPYRPNVLSEQARRTLRKMLMHWALGVKYQNLYRLRDQYPHVYDLTFGLIFQNSQFKPSGRAVKHLTQMIGNGQLVGIYSGINLPSGVHILKVKKGRKTLLIAWTEYEGGFSLSFPELPSLTRTFNGNSLATTTAGGRAVVQLKRAQSPIYLEFD